MLCLDTSLYDAQIRVGSPSSGKKWEPKSVQLLCESMCKVEGAFCQFHPDSLQRYFCWTCGSHLHDDPENQHDGGQRNDVGEQGPQPKMLCQVARYPGKECASHAAQ